MNLESLRVVHLLKEVALPASYQPAPGRALSLESCQRWLWIETSGHAKPSFPFQVYEGSDAYSFLLAVAAGLESQVIGETDIFGQLKDAWSRQRELLDVDCKSGLSVWMQRLFEDTKEIRSRYLQNLGGSSYGSLLRKLLKDSGGLAEGPTLLIGAGQLAHSVAPYLLDHELWICNRTAQRARELGFELQRANPSARIRVLGSFEEEAMALGQAAQVVICVPGDPERDPLRLRAVRKGARVVHLGLRAASEPGFLSLEDLFRIERSQSAVRSIQVQRARAACREKAILRELGGGSVSIAHGWEDLAAFGS